MGAALTARTYGELTALVSDLPTARDIPRARPERRGRRTWSASSATTVWRGVTASGLVPRRIQLQITYGRVTLDFTQAILSWPALQIDVQAHNGSVTLVTRPGIMVDTDDLEYSGTAPSRCSHRGILMCRSGSV